MFAVLTYIFRIRINYHGRQRRRLAEIKRQDAEYVSSQGDRRTQKQASSRQNLSKGLAAKSASNRIYTDVLLMVFIVPRVL